MPSDRPARAWLLHSSSSCCCIPVRAGVVLMSVLTFLLSAAISIIIWFEVFHSYQLSTKERVAFVLTGIVETLLFLASTLGFIGVVARKQLFVMIYTYFLSVHFVLNLVVGVYFLVIVRRSNRQQIVDYCSQVFVNTPVEPSCSRLLSVSTYVFIAIVAALLLLELYGVLIATRYVRRLRLQKRDDRSRRLGYFHALSKPDSLGHSRQASDNIELLHPQNNVGDPQDLEDVVLDIRPQSYMPVSTDDRDLPPNPPPTSPLLPPYPLPDTASGRRIRALPPRPLASPGATETTTRAEERTPTRLRNPHEPLSHSSKERQRTSPESEDERHSVYTSEVSTSAHAALMDYAAYMEPLFSAAPAAQKPPRGLVR